MDRELERIEELLAGVTLLDRLLAGESVADINRAHPAQNSAGTSPRPFSKRAKAPRSRKDAPK